jgi:predicted DNA-binding protein (UPF0251 family)
MSASAPRDTDRVAERDDFARALARFTRALCAGEDTRQQPALASAMTAALKEALAHDGWIHGGSIAGARTAAYRSLVRSFLRTSAARGPAPPRSLARQNASGLLVQPRVATEASRALAALARLEPVERAALLLVAVERLSYEDAAIALEIAEAELVAALARAREAFAALMAASGAAGKPHLRLVT